MTDTNLAQAIEVTNGANFYDINIKFLLADKQILARILKYAVQEFSDYDSLKKVRSIWLCLDNSEDGDSIEEIYLDRNVLHGNKKNPYGIDLMRGIIINVRNGETVKDSQNVLISMLEKLLSKSDVEEKKRILTEEYGMVMTTELEGRVQTMCNWSEAIKEMSYKEGIQEGIEKGIEKGIKKGIQEGIEKGIEKERLNAVERMIQADLTKAQIISCGYTEEEFAEAESILCAN